MHDIGYTTATKCFEDEGLPLAHSMTDFLGHNTFTPKSGEPVPSVTLCTHVHHIDPIWAFLLHSSTFAAFSPAEISSYPRSFRGCALALVLLREQGSGSTLSSLGHNMFTELLEVLAELALQDCQGNAELAANYLSQQKLVPNAAEAECCSDKFEGLPSSYKEDRDMQLSDISPIFYSEAEGEQVATDLCLAVQNGTDPVRPSRRSGWVRVMPGTYLYMNMCG